MRQKLRSHLTYANVTATLALFVALGGTTYAATGGNFILGQSNSATSTTALSAGTTGPALKATNTSTGTAGSFNAATGHPALAVNTTAKVSKLNADLLDGKDSTAFLGATAKAVDADKLDGHDWTDVKLTPVLRSAPFEVTGPLPYESVFTSTGGPFLIMTSGSGYRSSNSPGRMAARIVVDGAVVGHIRATTNERFSHKAFVPDFTVVTGFAAGEHIIDLQAENDAACGTANETTDNYCTTTDSSDFFNLSVIAIPSGG